MQPSFAPSPRRVVEDARLRLLRRNNPAQKLADGEVDGSGSISSELAFFVPGLYESLTLQCERS